MAYQIIRLPDLVGRLFQPPLSSINLSIAFIDTLLHVPHIVILEPQLGFVGRVFGIIFCFERLTVDFGTGTKILFRVGEKVVRTRSDEI